MKKYPLLFFNILLLNYLYANDTSIIGAGGNYAVLDSKNQNVQMVSEIIRIDLYNNHYEMNIDFHFFNFGETVELKVGFPEYNSIYFGSTRVKDFETTINDEKVEVEIVENLESSPYNIKITSWYVKNVIFEANKYTVSKVSYRADYAGHGPYSAVFYLYGTGSTWKDNVGQMTVEITNHTDYWLSDISFKLENVERKNNETIVVQLNNISANIDDTFSISISGGRPAFESPWLHIPSGDWRLRDEIITEKELILLNDGQLRILRNSIYAYHGYKFRSTDLQNYFNNQSWYRINNNFTENSFSANEKINLENIVKEENKRK